jgi:hypothetical protein
MGLAFAEEGVADSTEDLARVEASGVDTTIGSKGHNNFRVTLKW